MVEPLGTFEITVTQMQEKDEVHQLRLETPKFREGRDLHFTLEARVFRHLEDGNVALRRLRSIMKESGFVER